jgi:hypothetical protein
MVSSFTQLKKNRQEQFSKLVTDLKQTNTPNESRDDSRMWKPAVDKAGNGYAVIRFLPAPGGEDTPFVRIWDHGFQGPGGWYIEKSLTTLGQKDPLSEYNTQLWNTGVEENKDVVRKQKRRLHYISNILVVKDPSNPDNEGKVFLFQYGKKIFDKINDLMTPQFEDEQPINPFDFWEGANFKLKIRQVEGYRNYDKSEFDNQAPVATDDDDIEKIWKQEYSLQDFLKPSEFKSYEDLKKRLHKVLGWETNQFEERAAKTDTAEALEFTEPRRVEAKPQKVAESNETAPPWDDEDDSLKFFQQMVEED